MIRIKFIINGTLQTLDVEEQNKNKAIENIKERFKKVSKKIYFL